MLWHPTCADTVRPTALIPSINIRSCIWLATWLFDALGAETAVIVGHDWGAPVAWHAAQLRPDRFRGVIGLSVPFLPRGQVHPSEKLPETDDAVFYQQYFREPGIAEADLERDVRFSVRSTLYAFSGDAIPLEAIKTGVGSIGLIPRKGGILAGRII
jgi:pimeloyl-ACP methyl ester carboxylesterase